MAHNICKLFNFMEYEQHNQDLLKSINCAKWGYLPLLCFYFACGYTPWTKKQRAPVSFFKANIGVWYSEKISDKTITAAFACVGWTRTSWEMAFGFWKREIFILIGFSSEGTILAEFEMSQLSIATGINKWRWIYGILFIFSTT